MNIVVLLKQTFDTEEKIVIVDGSIDDSGAKYVINPYDEYAVEEALLQRDQHGGTVVVIGVGPERTSEALRTALAMGADEAVLIADERIQQDEASISHILSAYLRSQTVDLILGGNFSVDTGGGQVAIRLAKLLDLPHVGSITKLECTGSDAIVQRDAEGDTETIHITLPALFTAQQGLNEPRYPSLPGIMKAKKKPFKQLTLDDLQLSDAELRSLSARTETVSLSLPAKRSAGKVLAGDLPAQVKELSSIIQAARGNG